MNLEESFKFIRDTIYKHLPEKEYEAFIYGSRADGTAQKWSDIDVGIKGDREVPLRKLISIKHEIEDSNTPYMVDVVDFSSVSEKFKEVALAETVEL